MKTKKVKIEVDVPVGRYCEGYGTRNRCQFYDREEFDWCFLFDDEIKKEEGYGLRCQQCIDAFGVEEE